VEGVQDVNSLGEASQIDHPSSLNFVELIAGIVPRILREISEALERIAEETQRPHDPIISN
jgi:glycerol-3-phosphate responsive antiterminator